MRFMVLVPASAETEAGVMPTTDLLEKMGRFNEEMIKAGVMLAGDGLQPTSKGARIKFTGSKPVVTDGPFTESKELVAGFWIIQVKSKQEAIEWLKRAPFGEGTQLEIRQLFEAEDFGPELTPEMRERDQRLQARLASKQ